MGFEFEKLSEVSALEEFPEGAKVLIEHEGNIKRCAADGLGGKTEIIELGMDFEEEVVTGPTDRSPEELWELTKSGTRLIAELSAEYEGQTMTFSAEAAMLQVQGPTKYLMFGRSSMYYIEYDGTCMWELGG